MVVAGVVGVIVTASWTLLSAGQLLLAPVGTHGQTVTPVYEGWYPNPDGTISVSWGYFNRNSEEIVRVPVGADNRIEPGGPDRGQPTVFLPRRHRGVFTVVVPGDFGDDEVLWTLTFRGDTQTIPGRSGLVAHVSGFRQRNQDLELEVERIVADENEVIGIWTWRATHATDMYGIPATGGRLEVRVASLFRLRDGMLVDYEVISDALTGFRKMGRNVTVS